MIEPLNRFRPDVVGLRMDGRTFRVLYACSACGDTWSLAVDKASRREEAAGVDFCYVCPACKGKK